MRTLICDDHRLFSDALAALLTGNGFEVVACPTEPGHAVAQVALQSIDLCLMDVMFGHESSGIAAIRSLRAASPSTRVVVLTGTTDPALILEAIRAGADDVAFKGDDLEDVVASIRGAGADDAPLGRPVPSVPSGHPREHAAPRSRSTDDLGRFLTDREFEVLELLVHGRSAKQIARDLHIAYSTARTHVQNILAKLGVHSRLEAVAVAIERELARPGSPHLRREP